MADAGGFDLHQHLAGLGAFELDGLHLERLARRIEPQVGWEDLVLPAPVLAQLEELTARADVRARARAKATEMKDRATEAAALSKAMPILTQ